MQIKKYVTIAIISILIVMGGISSLQASDDDEYETEASNTLYYLGGNYGNNDFNSPQEMWPINDNFLAVSALSTKNVTIVDISDPDGDNGNVSVVSSIHVGSLQNRKMDVSDDKHYIFVNCYNNLTIINITDIYNPTIEGNINVPGAYYIGVSYVDSTGYAFCTDYNNNLVTSFNCNDLTNPTKVASVSYGNKPHGIWANDTIAFALGHKADSVATIDVSDPSAMSVLDTYSTGNLHRCSAIWGEYPPTMYVGSLDSAGFIFDISDPNNIAKTWEQGYGGTQTCTVIPNADETVMYVSVRDTGPCNSKLYAYNITNKASPVLLDMIQGSDTGVTFDAALAGGMVVSRNYIFCGDGDPPVACATDLKAVATFRFGDQINETNIQFIDINGGTNGTTVYDSTPTFNWTKVDDAIQYHLQVATDTAFTNLVVNLSNISEAVYPLEYSEPANVSFILPTANALTTYATYYTRVRAYIS